jgi:hypothetical protein
VQTDNGERVRYCPDGMPCTARDLARRIQNQEELVAKHAGQIFFTSGVDRKEFDHFWTLKQFYYSLSDDDLAQLKYEK